MTRFFEGEGVANRESNWTVFTIYTLIPDHHSIDEFLPTSFPHRDSMWRIQSAFPDT
jgi:hypothetical protein